MKTYTAKPGDIERNWCLFDAESATLGRLATEVAKRLQGKHKPMYDKNLDTGDVVVIVNAEKIGVTGNKARDKKYYRHTGYPGGLKETTFEKLLAKHPERVLEKAIKGMLPKGPMGRQMYRKLKIYAGAEHPHAAQQPQKIELAKKK